MNTAPTTTYAEAMSTCRTIDTTEGGGNGYPRRLKVAYTADTMQELRELQQAAEAAGDSVSIVELHRRYGWALWERTSYAHDLDDDAYMGTSERDWIITIDKDSDRADEAFGTVCGEGYEVLDYADLLAKAKAVEGLSKELPDPSDLEEGERVVCFLDSTSGGWGIEYTVKTGQNGYSYDTHQYCTALMIEERTEDADEA